MRDRSNSHLSSSPLSLGLKETSWLGHSSQDPSSECKHTPNPPTATLKMHFQLHTRPQTLGKGPGGIQESTFSSHPHPGFLLLTPIHPQALKTTAEQGSCCFGIFLCFHSFSGLKRCKYEGRVNDSTVIKPEIFHLVAIRL